MIDISTLGIGDFGEGWKFDDIYHDENGSQRLLISQDGDYQITGQRNYSGIIVHDDVEEVNIKLEDVTLNKAFSRNGHHSLQSFDCGTATVTVASIILGQYGAAGLEYQSHVVMGVSKQDFKVMQSVEQIPKSTHCTSFPDFPGAVWILPVLVCKVKFMERTRHGGLRQPIYRGLRDDKVPQECKTPKS